MTELRASPFNRHFDPTLRLLAEALLRHALYELIERGQDPDSVMFSLDRAWARQKVEESP